MFKLLETDYPGFVTPNHGYLESWARQGVLMVNAAMTVRAHNANSHKGKGWEKLLDAVVKTISDQRRNVVFLLWGKDAQNRGRLVDKKKHLVLESVHPSPLSAHRGFFDCQHFSKANKYLEENGQTPINWNSLVDDCS
jgi:uracil-DNA glycosylase